MDYNENKNNQNKKLIKKDNKNLEEKISDNNSKDSDKTIKSIPKSLSTYRGRSNYKGH
jgi:hypothetical protein